MDIKEKERLTRLGDVSPEAIATRMRAARISIGLSQKELAAEIGLSGTTFNSQEKKGAPSIQTMRHYYRHYDIDFNFIIHGDFIHLRGDVQASLFSALSDA